MRFVVPLALGHSVSGLFIDTSDYLPYPPTTDQASIYYNSTIPENQKFPYTSQYEKLYGKEVVSCMKQVEALFSKEVVSCSKGPSVVSLTSHEDVANCQCIFMKYVEEDCFDTGLNDNGMWDLEKLDYPNCKFNKET